MTIKVGDVVTWQPKPRPTIQPMGFRGATVLELGKDEGGKPTARINVGAFGVFVVFVEDLKLESKHET